MRYKFNSFDFLLETLADLEYDLRCRWDSYPCLDWPRGLSRQGYGIVHIEKKQYRVPRVSYELSRKASLPPDVYVLHHCDRPICWHPCHLFEGDAKDNYEDARAKLRHTYSDRNANTVIPEAEVPKIFDLLDSGMRQTEIANVFGVSGSTINKIVCGHNRKHLKLAPTEKPDR